MVLAAIVAASPAAASSLLGSASDFAVLGTSVQNTGLTDIIGGVGVSSGTAITGLDPVLVSGALNQGDLGTSATLDAGTALSGNILPDQSITLVDGASICGRALAENGAVSMDTNIASNDCGPADFGSGGFSNGLDSSGVPENATWAMAVCGFAMIGWAIRRRSKTMATGGMPFATVGMTASRSRVPS